ncbi:hypothetical protein XO12_02340 [Marinitoga sp. 1154]|uniref:FG-GAP repeat domain-containing protein n=1 Tax=Marinitoga sp. 1154 TaxID=1643335 RepID=UPI001586BF0A|nr:VCBS repeat-containing protein [Marinitoga sp. 1154]NUU98993.1 hypothetical protein [Marinitoga sp. 1154]
MRKIIVILLMLFPLFVFSEIIIQKDIDLNNDSENEKVILNGNYVSSVYVDNLKLSIIGKESTTINFDFGVYEPDISFYDFDGDGNLDIFFKGYSGGSGNYIYYYIYSYEKGELLSSKQSLIDLQAEFMDNFKALIKYKNYYTYIDLSDRKKQYIKMKAYNEYGQFTGDYKSLFLGGIAELKPVDFEHDGIYELKGTISLSGLFHADRIGYIYFIYSIREKQIKWLEISKVIYVK